MKKHTILLFIVLISIIFISSCNDNNQSQYKYENKDSIPGLFGAVELYDKYGDSHPPIGVEIEAKLIKKTDGSSANETNVTESDENGYFEFPNCKGGEYNLIFRKDGYIDNKIFALSHDELVANKLGVVKLSQTPPATIELKNIDVDSVKFDITRKIVFSDSRTSEYMVVARYFIDTLPNVSKEHYLTQFISGASVGIGGDSNELTISKTHNFLFSTSDIVYRHDLNIYICAYIDNAHGYEYKYKIAGEDKTEFPTLGEKSNTLFFTVDTTIITDFLF